MHATTLADFQGAVPTSPINFYPRLLSFLPWSPENAFYTFRLFEVVVAGALSVIVGLTLSRWFAVPVAVLLAVAWAVTFNHPMFIDGGFKNPINAATTLLFLTLAFTLSENKRLAILAAILIPFVVLTREAFALTSISVLAICWWKHGFKPMLMQVLVAGGTTAALLIWLQLFVDSPAEILNTYRAQARVGGAALIELCYEPGWSLAQQVWLSAKIASAPLLFLALPLCVGVIASVLAIKKRSLESNRMLLTPIFVSVMLIWPFLPEILFKYCCPYHWAQLIPGSLILIGVGGQWCVDNIRSQRALCGGMLAGLLIWTVCFVPKNVAGVQAGFHLSRGFRPLMVNGDWKSPIVDHSFYAKTASFLRDNAAPGETLLTSGFYYLLYPLTTLPPADPRIVDLTFSELAEIDREQPEAMKAIRETPPDWYVETLRFPTAKEHYLPNFYAMYQLETEFEIDPTIHYGVFGAKIYRRVDSISARVNESPVFK